MIRYLPETEADHPRIRSVVARAFERADEADLVEALRASPRFVPALSLVAADGETVVGHVSFTRLRDGSDGSKRGLALAPLAVDPERWGEGIGGGLVRDGLRRARRLGYGYVVVLGSPEYYRRFGFRSCRDFGVGNPFDAPDDAFTALELRPEALANVAAVRYPEPFDDL